MGTERGKRLRFLRNGDTNYRGVVMILKRDQCASLDSLLEDVTKAMKHTVFVPKSGMRTIFTIDGRPVTSIDDLEDGNAYVSSTLGEEFKKIDYQLPQMKQTSCRSKSVQRRRAVSCGDSCAMEPRRITIVRSGTRPRKIFRYLVSKRTAPSFAQLLIMINEKANLASGAVRKVFNQSGKPVTCLGDFFSHHVIFFVFGSEKHTMEDFVLDWEESNEIDVLNTVPGCSIKFTGSAVGRDKTTFPPEIQIKYDVGQVIGRGSYAIVRKCTSKSVGNGLKDFAMKIVDKTKCVGIEDLIENEMTILKGLRHQNIIKVIFVYVSTTKLYYLMELFIGGDLYTFIQNNSIPEETASLMTQNIASAIFYLHAFHIVHRDIKPENILVSKDVNKKIILKLTDFGLAMKVSSTLHHVVGSSEYMAPEILLKSGYGLKVDVWSSGVTLYYMLFRSRPFVHEDVEKLSKIILRGCYDTSMPEWTTTSDSCKALIGSMLTVDPSKRFTAEHVLEHPWVSKSSKRT